MVYLRKRGVMKYILIVLILLFVSCSINIPDIKITGEKTALEKQVMGEYSKIKEDAWMVASERGDNSQIIIIPEDKKEVINAVRNREYIKDDINEFKEKGFFAEKRDGLIEKIIDSDIFDKLSKKEQKIMEKVFVEENLSREIIISRIYELKIDKKKYDKATIREAFFGMNLAQSPKGTYFRDKEGKLNKK